MVVLAAACGLLIGLVIGGLGGGGGVLTVPALVYLLGLTAQDATTSSVIVVGISAALGVAVRIRERSVDWRVGLALGAVGTPVAFAGSVLNQRVDRPTLLLAFAAVTILAAALMLAADDTDPTDPNDTDTDDRAAAGGAGRRTGAAVAVRPRSRRRQLVGVGLVRAGAVVVGGAAVGFLTGFLGVGGGFLVLPVLVVVLRMPTTRAIGTSLLVILVNSAAALASRSGDLTLDWTVLAPFALASLVGTVLGHRGAARLSGTTLTRTFAVLLLIVGVVIGVDALRTPGAP